LAGGKPLSPAEWAAWLNPALLDKTAPGLSEDEQKQFGKRQTLLKQLLTGTNLPESLLDVFNRESNNMVQGIVVFSDGRNSGRPGSSTQFSAEVFEELRARARRAKVPIFTVAVGEYRSEEHTSELQSRVDLV